MIKDSAVPLSGCTALVLALSKCGRRNRVNLVFVVPLPVSRTFFEPCAAGAGRNSLNCSHPATRVWTMWRGTSDNRDPESW